MKSHWARIRRDASDRATRMGAGLRAIGLVGLTLVGCGGETVSVELAFPSSDSFVRSANARLFVVDVGEDLGACPDLVMQSELGNLTGDVFQSEAVSVCDASVGRLTVPDVDEGLYAFVAAATNEAGQVLLTGCTIADAYVDDAPLQIVLAPTERYRTTYPVGTAPETCSADDKCLRGCR